MSLLLFLTSSVLFSCLDRLTEAQSTHLPRRVFTENETAVQKSPLPGDQAPVRILLREEPDTVTVVGLTHLYTYSFQLPKKAPEEKKLVWKEGTPDDDSYNITVVHERQETDQALVCGTDGRETLCCGVNLTAQSPTCTPSKKLEAIERGIKSFIMKEGEPSALVESAESADLYITNSGSQETVGIHKFGKNRVGPDNPNKEQHYVGLMLSRRKDEPLQDKVFAFYKEKNRATDPEDVMWLPYVTRVCMADIGGRKNNMQLRWTSQMTARLFCGDPHARQHFSELVDVAVVQADQWQDTRVYGLFRNEWNMTAVCVYTIKDIDHIFATSAFKGQSTANSKARPRKCVEDSTIIPHETLKMIAETSELEQRVQPVNKSGPLICNHHHYTHIYVDSSQHKRNDLYTVLFLTLINGAIHKVIQTESQIFLIAEYRPFNHRAHLSSIILHPSSRKLYVNTRSELVQLDVGNCAEYGDCQDCVLARDPYCGWDRTHCSPATNDTLQDLTTGDYSICPPPLDTGFRSFTEARASVGDARERVHIALRSQSRYFLSCPMLSHHAEYTWHQDNSFKPCRLEEQECLLLISNMSQKEVGKYTCKSEERGFTKVLVQYELRLRSKAAIGRLSSLLVWVCLVAALIKS